jgi:hypothetical protein
MRTCAIIALLAGLLAACDCGQNSPGPGLPDVSLDGPDDVSTDGMDDVAGDPLEDVAGDAGDVLDEDTGSSLGGNPFQCETSGGGMLSSESYSMDLFIGPVRPVGRVSSDNYQMKLGPAGMRSP